MAPTPIPVGSDIHQISTPTDKIAITIYMCFRFPNRRPCMAKANICSCGLSSHTVPFCVVLFHLNHQIVLDTTIENQEHPVIKSKHIFVFFIFSSLRFHLVTFSSGQHCSQIDFIIARREDRHVCLDCKVIHGVCVVYQHKLVVADFHFRVRL
jgi:hypothetical protein